MSLALFAMYQFPAMPHQHQRMHRRIAEQRQDALIVAVASQLRARSLQGTRLALLDRLRRFVLTARWGAG